MRRALTPLALLPILLAMGCALGPTYKRPQVDVTEAFRAQSVKEAASLADQPWWELFGDETLKGLISEALKRNFDVRTAVWRVEEFRARAGIQSSDRFPVINAQGEWERGRQSSYAPGGGTTGNEYDVHATLAWELDLWGRVRRMNEAALANYLGAQDFRRGVYLSTVAQVAQAYFQLRELDQRLEVAKATTTAFQETLDLFSRRLAGGAASALETARAQAALAGAATNIPTLERQIQAQENLLSLLVGRKPGPVKRGAVLNAQPLPPAIPPGLPSALLERRPDLREAEQSMVAANAAVGVATANYFPTLSLTGFFGGLSPQAAQLFDQGKGWTIAPLITAPAFQGLRLKHQKAAAVAQWEQARTRYEGAVMGAFGEVSTALVAYEKLALAEKEQARAVVALQEATRLATLRYTAGLSSYLEVLDAQQQLFPAQTAEGQARLARLLTLVQLYKALGGGWNLADPTRPQGH